MEFSYADRETAVTKVLRQEQFRNTPRLFERGERRLFLEEKAT
jgi:hypothetical protein